MVYFFKLYAFQSLEAKTEICYYVQSRIDKDAINEGAWTVLFNLLSQNGTYDVNQSSVLETNSKANDIVEFGPNLRIKTAWSTNAIAILKKSCVNSFARIEKSFRTIDKEYFEMKYDKMTQTIYKKPLVSFDAVENDIQSYQQSILYEHPIPIKPSDIRHYNDIYQLGLNNNDIHFYFDLFANHIKKNPNTAELVMLATLNNEHSRHRFFKGKYTLYDICVGPIEESKLNDPKYDRGVCAQYIQKTAEKSLMEEIQLPYLLNPNNSVIAFSDNASAIKGFELLQLNQYWNPMLENLKIGLDSDDENDMESNTYNGFHLSNRRVIPLKRVYHPSLKAETHNFPTGVAPFEGAATGVGGRIRDTIAIGRGGFMVAGMAGYSVGNLYNNPKLKELPVDNTPLEILIKASDGASDYGNKIGEPIILGFTRSFGDILEYRQLIPTSKPTTSGFLSHRTIKVKERKEWLKPIMFSAGIGLVDDNNMNKESDTKLAILQVGGPPYRIGINGGSASSKEHNLKDKEFNFAAVQRGDPEMESKIVKFINICLHMGFGNPILTIHDQGAGGMANVLAEICEPHGGIIYLNDILLGDDSMSDMEVLLSEYQEQVCILVQHHDIDFMKILARREGVNINHIGSIVDEDKLTIIGSMKVNRQNHDTFKDMYLTDDEEYADEKLIKIIDLPVNDIFKKLPQQKFDLIEPYIKWEVKRWVSDIKDTFLDTTLRLLKNINVGSKRFLTSKVDRSVGQVAQQQTIGLTQCPLSDYAMIANNYFGSDKIVPGKLIFPGVVTSIGEQPIKGIYDIEKMVRLTVAEMLTNMIWAGIEDFNMIKCAANWMWSNTEDTDKYLLRKAVLCLKETLIELGIATDGGKDSLSMSIKSNNETVKSPNTLTLTGYVTTMDIRQKVNAGFVREGNHIIYINLSNKYNRMGGSILSYITGSMSSVGPLQIPDFENLKKFPELFEFIQYNIKIGNIVAGHDISDGGLITSLLEMCFPNNKGCDVDFSGLAFNSHYETFMCEEPGLLIEYKHDAESEQFIQDIKDIGYFQIYNIGLVTTDNITVKSKDEELINKPISVFRKAWEEPAHHIEEIQIGHKLAMTELNQLLASTINDPYNVPFPVEYRLNNLENEMKIIEELLARKQKQVHIKLAVIREEGSNGDREMKAAFALAGFDVYDIHMNDIVSGTITLDEFMGIVFVGGFSYADTFGAATGWASCIQNNALVRNEFKKFYDRTDTFSFGVCNGCQLMSILGWIPFESKFVENDSKRFESRFTTVTITENNSIMLKSLKGTTFGMWSAHGEGKYVSNEINDLIENDNFEENSYYNTSFPVRYVDYDGKYTETYPHNPNGSSKGIAAVVSDDGRHLAIMPHPERSYMMWQGAYCPPEISQKMGNLSPWFLMFKDAFMWCQERLDEKIAKQKEEEFNIEDDFM